MIGYAHITIPLSLKILICLLIVLSVAIVYFWEPGGKKVKQKSSIPNHALQYIDVDPGRDLAEKEILLQPQERKAPVSQHATLQELDEYVQTLKRETMKNCQS